MSFFNNESNNQSKTKTCVWGRGIVGHAAFDWMFDSLLKNDIQFVIISIFAI